MDEKQLDKWRKLADEATPGPWYLYDGYINRLKAYCVRIGTPDFTVLSAAGRIADLEATQIDFEFIAVAREAVPALIAEVERLQAEVNRLYLQNAALRGEATYWREKYLKAEPTPTHEEMHT